ncbi:MAG: hypothetical protein Q4A55_04755 [Aerococcus sp.]|nr:hypothetical protein [Aerococcus sp.]
MNETFQWQQQLLQQALSNVKDYETRALIEACATSILELQKRQTQAEGRLDGIMWNHEEW